MPTSIVTIIVPAGTYHLTLGTLGLTAQSTITFNGASSQTTIITGNKTFTVMSISANVSVTLSQLTIEGGAAPNGGGIYVNYPAPSFVRRAALAFAREVERRVVVDVEGRRGETLTGEVCVQSRVLRDRVTAVDRRGQRLTAVKSLEII